MMEDGLMLDSNGNHNRFHWYCHVVECCGFGLGDDIVVFGGSGLGGR